jgi:branched-chain amino acid transport system substrate-binding protein
MLEFSNFRKVPGCRQLVPVLFASVLLGSATVVAYAQQTQPGDALVGFAVSHTGFMSQFDLPNSNAALMRIEEQNAKGGLLGRQIKTVLRDARSNVQEAARVGTEVAAMDPQLMLVTGTYDVGAASALPAQNRRIITFSMSAADPKMGTATGPYSFTANGAAQSEGILMAEWGFRTKGFKTAYMLEDLQLEYTRSGCAGFQHGFRRVAGDAAFLGKDTFRNSDPSIAAQITRLRALPQQPDVIFICTLPPGGPAAIRQIRAAGIETPIMSVVAMGDRGWLSSVPNLSNVYIPTFMSLNDDDPRSEVRAFIERYQKKFGEPGTAYIGMGYSLIDGWIKAVERAGSFDSDKVLAEFHKFKDEPLLIGATSYTKDIHFQVNQPRVILEIQNGKQKALGMFRADWVPPHELLYRIGKYAN